MSTNKERLIAALQEPLETTLTRYKTHLDGLKEDQVEENRDLYGENVITKGQEDSIIKKIYESIINPFTVILLVIALVSFITNVWLAKPGEEDPTTSIIIVTLVLISGGIRFIQELRSDKAASNLSRMIVNTATVLRDGSEQEIPIDEIVVGDVVKLSAGDMIPADGRLIENASLKVDESALTGESLAVEKSMDTILAEAPLGDRTNMLFSGSFVTYGRGKAVVTDVGMQTEVGKIAGLLKSTSEKQTPLQANLDDFGKKLSILILIFCGILFAINVFRGEKISSAFMFAVALAVAAIPEALSSIVTIVLSFGTQKMAKEHAIIRKLQAVEGLGSVSVICSDKTGTLTQNKMTVEDYYVDELCIKAEDIDLNDPSQSRLLIGSMLCNDSKNTDGVEIGDPTETALINLGSKLGLDPEEIRTKYPRESENPFDSDRKLMSTKHTIENVPTMIVKGAVDVLLTRMDQIQIGSEVRPMTEQDRKNIEEQNQAFSRQGLRVLAFAYKTVSDELELTLEDEYNLTFIGLIAMMDPPREESKAAVAECKKAGIRPIMITGDHKVTAAAIAKRIGILEDESEACEGAEIDKLSDEELKDFVEGISVYARVSPEHKIRIVRAWQEKGNIVSMTGDGVNDAPALKQADIGVAMGITGSEVSKDAAAMVLTDDNFATIVKAVENGRNIYRNIKNSIQFLLSGNFGAILAVLYASIAGLPVPFAPVHLLFINLLTDSLPAIALGLEPHSKEVMEEKPRPMNESILTKDFMLKIGTEGLSIGITTMIAFLIGYKGGNALLGSTMAFATLCSARLFHGFNCKSDRPVVFTSKLLNNIYLIGAFVVGLALVTMVVMIPGLHSIFKVQTLNLTQLLIVYGLAAVNIPIIQILKAIRLALKKKEK